MVNGGVMFARHTAIQGQTPDGGVIIGQIPVSGLTDRFHDPWGGSIIGVGRDAVPEYAHFQD